MPRIPDSLEQVNLPASHYGYTKVAKQKLTAAEYSLVTIMVDVSGSVSSFAPELEKCLKQAIASCRRSPKPDNLLLRVVAFGSIMHEAHGFKPLADINESDYDNFYPVQHKECGAMTSLYDTFFNAVAAMNDMAKDLTKDDYKVNAINFCITDGVNNQSTATPLMIRCELERGVKEESLESQLTILIGVNLPDAECKRTLETFKQEANLAQFVDIGNASDKTMAKLAQFISKSTTSTVNAAGSGKPSQTLTF